MYYDDKKPLLQEIFGATSLTIGPDSLSVDGKVCPIVEDVIICLDPADWPASLRARLPRDGAVNPSGNLARDIQDTFGQEWTAFPSILAEHRSILNQYFDLVDLPSLSESRVCDLGCGMGRWSYFVSEYCREIVLVDFSDAIFVARRNLKDRPNAVFVMADVTRLPFAHDFADLVFCLGVLHHLPTPALDAVASLRPYSPRLLIYLYYALDNRPPYFRAILALVTGIRRILSRIKNDGARRFLAALIAYTVYLPMVALGSVLRPFGIATRIPLYEMYRGKSLATITQDAYDRFFTGIEQRVARRDIETLNRFFGDVIVADTSPYWHFLCVR